MIFDMRRRGLSISAIARKTGLCRKTIRQHLKRGLENPVYGPRHPRPWLLDPYEGYLRERVESIVPMNRARPRPCDTATAVVFLCTSNPTCIVIIHLGLPSQGSLQSNVGALWNQRRTSTGKSHVNGGKPALPTASIRLQSTSGGHYV